MRKQKQTVKIEHTDAETISICYYDDPRRSSYLRWDIPMNEADNLAKWWAVEGSHISKKQLPVKDTKCGSVLISTFTCSGSVNVKGLTKHGKSKMLGYSLPRPVVENLSVWLQDKQHFFGKTTDRMTRHV